MTCLSCRKHGFQLSTTERELARLARRASVHPTPTRIKEINKVKADREVQRRLLLDHDCALVAA